MIVLVSSLYHNHNQWTLDTLVQPLCTLCPTKQCIKKSSTFIFMLFTNLMTVLTSHYELTAKLSTQIFKALEVAHIQSLKTLCYIATPLPQCIKEVK